MSRMRSESGQAGIEWVGLTLLVSVVLTALVSTVPVIDGRSVGGFLTHRIMCAAREDCHAGGERELARAYGARDAALVREHAPNIVYEPGERQLPVDFRECRAVRCATAPDDRDLDAHRTDVRPAGHRVHARRSSRREHLPPVLALLPRLELDGGEPGQAVEQGAAGRLARLARRRLGGLPGAHRPAGRRTRALLLARPLPVVQAVRVPQRLGPAHRVDARVAGQPRRSSGARARGLRTGGALGTDTNAPEAVEGPLPARSRPGSTCASAPRRGRGSGWSRSRRSTTRTYRPRDPGIRPPWRKKVYDDPESGES